MLFLSIAVFTAFVIFSYTVAKEMWQAIDFDTTVKLQDHISREFDQYFSYLSLFGSAEVTFSICLLMGLINLFKLKFWAFIAWILVIPASFIEIFGKLVLFHPGTPVLFHRSIIETNLPSFYIHTNFSYPSGHMIRTTFLFTMFILLIFFSSRGYLFKFSAVLILLFAIFMMSLTRVYLGEHWLSDVIGGAMLGSSVALFSGVFIIKPSKRTHLLQ